MIKVSEVKNSFLDGEKQIEVPEISPAEAGEPRTILLLGSDQRWEDKINKVPARSDTILLVRLNPKLGSITMLSIPRDFKVTIPGTTDQKINAAYATGGARLTVQTIKKLFQDATGKPFEITNVINTTFGGFRRAINYIDGVYVDVDHHYFNDNSGLDRYAAINVKAGYQKLRGQKALDYVRFRHTDNDLFRAARQQNFLHQLKSQPGAAKFMDLSEANTVAKLIGRYTQVDKSFRSSKQIIAMLKLVMWARNKPVHHVRFMVRDEGNLLTSTPQELNRAITEFLHPSTATKPVVPRKRKNRKHRKQPPAPVVNAYRSGEDLAIVMSRRIQGRFYFPAKIGKGDHYVPKQSRVYNIRDATGKKRRSYRLVIQRANAPEYYGIQGTTWKNPPILDAAHDEKTVRGRKLFLFYDSKHLTLVAWKTKNACYWVTNTLSKTLRNDQMITIARSLRQLKR